MKTSIFFFTTLTFCAAISMGQESSGRRIKAKLNERNCSEYLGLLKATAKKSSLKNKITKKKIAKKNSEPDPLWRLKRPTSNDSLIVEDIKKSLQQQFDEVASPLIICLQKRRKRWIDEPGKKAQLFRPQFKVSPRTRSKNSPS